MRISLIRESRSFIRIGAVILAILLIALGIGCCSARKNQQLTDPREGKMLNGKVAIIYSYNYRISVYGLEKLHPFDIKKYERIYSQLIKEKVLAAEAVFVPEAITDDDILLVQSQSFLESLEKPKVVATYLEAPQTALLPAGIMKKKMLAPFRLASGGTILAARQALNGGIGINIGGGYHHAKPEAGEGFCVFADIPIAIRKLQQEGLIKKALVIDLDVHQGNGNAVCLADDDSTYTFSMHQAEIYPIPKEESDLDIELLSGEGDEQVLARLAEVLPEVFVASKPDIVFYVAGCDMLNGDPLASLAMTEDGIVKRDQMVIDACVKRQIPVVMTLGGGYSKYAWRAQYKSIKNIIANFAVPQ